MKKTILVFVVGLLVGLLFFSQLGKFSKPAFAAKPVELEDLGENRGSVFTKIIDHKESVICYSTFGYYGGAGGTAMQCFRKGPGAQN